MTLEREEDLGKIFVKVYLPDYDLFYMYRYDSNKYSIAKTVAFIQKYEFSYQSKEGYLLFINKIKNTNYSKVYDEPLVGLVEEPEEFPVLQQKMIELLSLQL